jgi:nicotinamide mononucleotide transporter
MGFLLSLFDADAIMIDAFGYSLSWLEAIGVATCLWCVVLAARERVANWPVGIVNNVFFFVLFFETRLYPDMFLQVFYAVTALYGWWRWLKPSERERRNRRNELAVTSLRPLEALPWIAGLAAMTALLGFIADGLHSWLPALFPDPAAAPYADAFVVSGSIAATFLMAGKKLECWIAWGSVDAFAAVLYASRGLAFLSIEYAAFAAIAVSGYLRWRRESRSHADAPRALITADIAPGYGAEPRSGAADE